MHCVNDKPYRLPHLIVQLVLVLVLINYLFLVKLCVISLIVTFTDQFVTTLQKFPKLNMFCVVNCKYKKAMLLISFHDLYIKYKTNKKNNSFYVQSNTLFLMSAAHFRTLGKRG